MKEQHPARGAAACHIELTKCVLTVRHNDGDGPILLRVPAYEGDWSTLWTCLERLGNTSKAFRATGVLD